MKNDSHETLDFLKNSSAKPVIPTTVFILQCATMSTYSSVLNRSHMATIWNFDPNYSLTNVTQDTLPKKFRIVAMWLLFSTEEYSFFFKTTLFIM